MAINRVGKKGIIDGSVATADLLDNAVTTAKLQDGVVTNAKLSNSSVTIGGNSLSLGGSLSISASTDWQSVVTADGSTFNTAVSGKGYFIDTTSAAHTINLPASATQGDYVAIKDYAGTFATNNVTIGRNGHNVQGEANNPIISTNRASLVLVYVDATKGWLYWEESNVADLTPVIGSGFISATGGTVTESGDYKIHTFTGDGCFVVANQGAGTPTAPSVVDYLVVAGGGGGGTPDRGGGGGAGGFRESSGNSGCYTASPLATPTGITVSATTYPVTVGAGGGATPGTVITQGCNGSNSVFSTITSAGGGGGGGGQPGNTSSTRDGVAGGSGGGSGSGGPYCAPGGTGNTPPVSPPQGNNGGSANGGDNRGGGGGGGATAAGTTAPVNPSPCISAGSVGGPGGAGATTSISASPTAYSGGGAGGLLCSAVPLGTATGGSGGGGDQGLNGTANTGGGGGGAIGVYTCGTTSVGSGGKGIVIIRYKFQ